MVKLRNIQYSTAITIFIHIVIWLLVLHLQFDIPGLIDSFVHFFSENEKQIDEAFIIIPTLIILFYWNSHFLVPKYLNRKSWWKYLIGLSLSFLILFYSGVLASHLLIKNGYESNFEELMFFFDFSLVLHLVVIGISTSLGISKIAMKNALQKQQAIDKQKEAELKYLNAQFNPHFLYNTLNGIYAQAVEEEATKTTEAILKLSEIMRYPINQGLKQTVLLTEEIKFVEDYIALQKIRIGQDYPISFEKEGDLNKINIIPFSLMPLVENAFKYGVSPRDKTPIIFKLSAIAGEIQFISENKIGTVEDKNSHLVGIENLKARLNIVYKDDYCLDVKEVDNRYLVKMKLKY